MKKLYTRLMMAIVAITMAIPAKAAVESVAELFGTYRMTANVEIIDQAYKDKLSGDCEVKIMADPVGIYACEIDGLFGIEDSYQQVSKMVVQEDGRLCASSIPTAAIGMLGARSTAGWPTLMAATPLEQKDSAPSSTR